MEIKNAKIKSTYLGFEDHYIFTCYLHLEYDGSGQAAGGYAMDIYDPILKKRVGHRFGTNLIIEILRTLEISSWEELKGQLIRVKADHSKVYAIGHIINDKWLCFEQFFNQREA